MPFVRNTWYPIAWSRDIGDAPTRRTVVAENVALYRTSRGRVVALADLCPHRMLPLSKGKVRGDALECGYHGTTFDSAGRCVRVPGQDRIPAGLEVRSYPTAENLGLVWIWTGEAARADAGTVYDLPQSHDPLWARVDGDALHLKTHYLNLADNLTDPSHVTYVHPTTLGDDAGIGVPVRHKRDGDTVVVWRWITNSPPIPLFAKYGALSGSVDRWQYYFYHAPSVAMIDFGACAPGAIAEGEDRGAGMRMFTGHFITPVDDKTCVDHWFNLRNFKQDDRQLDERVRDALRMAFEEDRAVLEAIQLEEEARPGFVPARLRIDAASLHMRRAVDEMIAREQGAVAAEKGGRRGRRRTRAGETVAGQWRGL